MQLILGYMRRAITEYNMLADGDRVAVGVSGGKDSIAMLVGLARLRRFIGIDYDIVAVTIDPQFGGVQTDYTAIEQLCERLGVKYVVRRTSIGEIIFDIRKESNPCSLCSRMRRGLLHDIAKENNCNKVALGHNFDDAVETFIMNLFNEGRIGCFSPVTYMSRKDVSVIRPLVFAPEKDVRKAVKREDLPVVKSKCPVDGHTAREWTKNFLADMEKQNRGITNRIFGAIKRGQISGW